VRPLCPAPMMTTSVSFISGSRTVDRIVAS
jgi:hypothetical protein